MSVNKTDTLFEDPFSKAVWETTYKDHNDKTLDDTFYRVAKFVASAEETDELKAFWTDEFYRLLSGFNATAGGRIYSNAGTEWGGTTLMNCFVGPRVDYDCDSLEGIFEHLQAQSKTLKSEGGWGENFSYIRPRGSFIHGIGVETPGAVKYMESFDKMSEIITSGSGKDSNNVKAKGKIRKGAMMGVLDVWHPDILEFITAKQTQGRLSKFNVSVNCSDEFMAKVNLVNSMRAEGADEAAIYEADTWELRFPVTTDEHYKAEWKGHLRNWEAKGYPVKVYKTVSATWLWNLIMESTYNRAEPGVLFLDRANYFNPLSYAETIQATNPCLVGDTLVSTNKGLQTIEDLCYENRGITEYCFSSSEPQVGQKEVQLRPFTDVFPSGIKDVVTIHLSNGMEITATPDHRFWITTQEWVEAQHLVGHTLELISPPFAEHGAFPVAVSGELLRRDISGWTLDLAFVLGWLVGDGWMTGDKIGAIFGKDDEDALRRFTQILKNWGFNPTPSVDANRSTTLYVHNVQLARLLRSLGFIQCRAPEKRVPSEVFKLPKEYVAEFLKGLFSADGSVSNMTNGNYWVSLASSSKRLVNDVQQLLLMFGITHHKAYFIDKTSIFEYTTVNGESRNSYYDLRVFGRGIVTFFDEIGFEIERKQTILEELQTRRFKNKVPEVRVTKVTPAGSARVFDITVPDFHNFVAGSVVVHNCGEQTLAPGGVCNLGSLNLTQFVNTDRTGFDLERLGENVRLLVRFLDDINTVSHAPLPVYEESMKKKRRIGCGILGWGSALFMLKIRFGSEQAHALRDEVMGTIAREGYKASIDLAVEKGMFEYCDPVKHYKTPFIRSLGLDGEYLDRLLTYGIRNSSVLSIQPTGNTSIFANVVSGGLEPIFMPEYIRTVIVNTMPKHIEHCTPKWYEGEMHETEMFKWTKEGEEDILRGEDEHGTVYKIDTNRGLTREVLCEDYGVRYLKRLGEWDPDADWAVTTVDLSVDDHVADLIGFARWVDSAMSKTVNVPNDYPFEKFSNIYLDSYNSGFVKGVTTYRAGTMMAVLSMKEEKEAETQFDEEVVLDDVKLPDSAPAKLKTIRAEGRKWYVTVVTHEGSDRPFSIFVKTNDVEKTVVADAACDALLALARKKGIPERHCEKVANKIRHEKNSSKIGRLIGFNLRHGVLIKNIVAVLDGVEEAYVGTFVFAIKKFLSQYIKDGEKVEDEKCLECSSENVVFQEGCKICLSCGSSRCG